MKIVAINGSPKPSHSTSGSIINKLAELMNQDITTYRALDLQRNIEHDYLQKYLLTADVLLVVFPLYIDCLHSALLDILPRLEHAAKYSDTALPTVYAIVNCGLYDAEQNTTALRIVENFCKRAKLTWGYGIGIGCGGMIDGNEKRIIPKGPLRNIYYALGEMSKAISLLQHQRQSNVYVRARVPRFVYHLLGDLGLRIMFRKSSSKVKINARPHSTCW